MVPLWPSAGTDSPNQPVSQWQVLLFHRPAQAGAQSGVSDRRHLPAMWSRIYGQSSFLNRDKLEWVPGVEEESFWQYVRKFKSMADDNICVQKHLRGKKYEWNRNILLWYLFVKERNYVLKPTIIAG